MSLRQRLLLFTSLFVTGIVLWLGVPAYYKMRELKEARENRRVANWYVGDRYKKIEKGMSLRDVADVLGASATDGMGNRRWWLFKDVIVEIEIDEDKRVKEIRFPRESDLPWNKHE